MGQGRDKRKKAKEKKDGPVPGKGAEKTERHEARNEDKKERRVAKKLEGNEDDIDALLAQFALEEKAKQSVIVEVDCSPPTARVNASFVPYVAPRIHEIIMFGGECIHLTTGKVKVFNDLYRFNTEKKTWTRVSSPNSPTPRCAHQAVLVKGFMYVFGGEFTSPNQERFHHFRETWRLDLATWEWDLLPAKGGPSGRSGHRMAVHGTKILMFGGFFDNSKEVRYFNDLWLFDVETLKWTELATPTPKPAPRGGFQMAVVNGVLWLYGGYSKHGDDEDEDIEHGTVHDDFWILDSATFKWERLKKAGMAPGPRASFSLAPHGARLFLFGGVSDHEAAGGLDMYSEFHNDLFTFSTEKRRWYATEIRAPRKGTIKSGGEEAVPGAGDKAGEAPATETAVAVESQDRTSAAYLAAVKIQAHFRGHIVRKAYRLYKIGGTVSEILYSPAAFGVDMSAANMPKPRARISAQVCVLQNNMWLFGGTVEMGSKEITLDDMWCIDLVKLDGWRVIRENTVGEEMFKEDDGSSSYTSDGSDSDEPSTSTAAAAPAGTAPKVRGA